MKSFTQFKKLLMPESSNKDTIEYNQNDIKKIILKVNDNKHTSSFYSRLDLKLWEKLKDSLAELPDKISDVVEFEMEDEDVDYSSTITFSVISNGATPGATSIEFDLYSRQGQPSIGTVDNNKARLDSVDIASLIDAIVKNDNYIIK